MKLASGPALAAIATLFGALVGCPGPSGPSGGLEAASPSSSAQAIINGESCGEDVEPTAVAIIADGTFDFGNGQGFDFSQPLCTGTLIAPDVVLLAAHCLDLSALVLGFAQPTRADFYVTFEADLSRYSAADPQGPPLPLPESAIPVRDRVAHPSFDIQALGEGTGGTENDIALLFLEVNVTDVQPEIVITKTEAEQLDVGSAVTIAGWGQQTADQQPPPGTVGVKKCGSTTLDELGPTLMQVGEASASTRKCHGDSGGPTYTEVTTSSSIKRRVIGVTSRAYSAALDCGAGGVDTRVDAFLEFIDDEMSARCDDDSRTFCAVPGIIPASFFDGSSAEGEGEGEGVGDVALDTGCPQGCSSAPVDAAAGLGLLLLLRRRRR
ncbi:MAG: trypsin-like serine protease [Deltaproteobacteria bacterium]|nr:trypsin-like serine protease [Deltaproteobacteria bacterium]